MLISTSYFYMVRFLKPYQIPLSTALSDPKWFHMNNGKDFKFVDKNGVLNGCRAEFLKPGTSCNGLCHGKPCQFNPTTCQFLKSYHDQIFTLNRKRCISAFMALGELVRTELGFKEEPEIVLLVHEAPTNECSERSVIQEFFECGELLRS